MERLTHRTDFLAVAAGVRVPTVAFTLQARGRGDDAAPRVGFTVSRKVGTAVERNRARRRLRAMVRRTDAAFLDAGHDYVLVARRPALNEPFDRLLTDFQSALRRAAAKRSAGESDKRGGKAADKTKTAGARDDRGACKEA